MANTAVNTGSINAGLLFGASATIGAGLILGGILGGTKLLKSVVIKMF